MNSEKVSTMYKYQTSDTHLSLSLLSLSLSVPGNFNLAVTEV